MSTYSEARRLGAPAILTDGAEKTFFKISDWTPSTHDVYGRPCDRHGEASGDYQKLPEGLREWTK
jgi:hypothetical protein